MVWLVCSRTKDCNRKRKWGRNEEGNCHKKKVWLVGCKEERVNRNCKLSRTDFVFLWQILKRRHTLKNRHVFRIPLVNVYDTLYVIDIKLTHFLCVLFFWYTHTWRNIVCSPYGENNKDLSIEYCPRTIRVISFWRKALWQ